MEFMPWSQPIVRYANETLQYNKIIGATGATLGVLALFLLLFLLILCLPWQRCASLRGRCLRRRDPESQMQTETGYPVNGSIIPFPFPNGVLPAVLPKLPNYQECIDNRLILSDEAPPPATPPPLVERQIRNPPPLGQPSSSNIDGIEHFYEDYNTRSGESTPPPAYSSFRSVRSLARETNGLTASNDGDGQQQQHTPSQINSETINPDTASDDQQPHSEQPVDDTAPQEQSDGHDPGHLETSQKRRSKSKRRKSKNEVQSTAPNVPENSSDS